MNFLLSENSQYRKIIIPPVKLARPKIGNFHNFLRDAPYCLRVTICRPAGTLCPRTLPVYGRISDLGGAHTNYDVVESLTVPLIIRDDEASAGGEVDAYRTRGYFPLSSQLFLGPP